MTTHKQQLGDQGEAMAVQHLRRMGYKIIERNYRSRLGEIDIVAKHKGVLVFAEVKTRRSERYGHPKWAITAAKQRQISKVALEYLKKNKSLDQKSRFDVVTVQTQTSKPTIEVITNAFELAYG